ncbi:hypothetical protein ACFYTS_07030 [Nocardia sp. NPDC004151]|uniref:hypothetical protein n=1 Tax=Nocardia sp. NPDC004151 TaxID=3364304 RepID=UPI0036B5779A
MVVGVEIEFDGVTIEQYARVMEMVGAPAGGPMPDGGLFGWVAATESGIRVAEVWESEAAFRRFVAERLIPAARRIGIVGEPRVTFRDVLGSPRPGGLGC